MATVRLVHGDLFDGPADMVTLPCSTEGTVTEPVERRLRQFSLPHPGKMRLGQVEICTLDDADQVAQYVAFAASVFEFSSTLDAISEIGEALASATRDLRAVRSISVPLLGTGAGGLSPDDVVRRLKEAFEKNAAPAAVLGIFVLQPADYRVLAGIFEEEGALASTTTEAERTSSSSGRRESWVAEQRPVTSFGAAPPRVFISHTTLSDAHTSWLDALYRFLRENGINARIDHYSLRPGMDLVQWMCNELQQADRVLLICDARYADRADGRHGGVGWETMLIQGDLYASMYRDKPEGDIAISKYIPIVITEEVDKGRPDYLATKLAVHWPPGAQEDAKRQALLRELYGITEEPPIGPRPSFG
ncbi:MAG TPA: TIR domain-containing protein [Solirubrobacteraceae bacterium]|nr:TIR domain-containing protein [Solirubrobacteraceae bacterium]